MASKSESSFGARLQNANDLYNYMTNFPNFAPPRPEESPATFYNLLQEIATINSDETLLQQQYNLAVTSRTNTFRKNPNSVAKLLAPIRAQVQAQYGKDSVEFNQVDAIVHRMRKSKLIIVAATEKTPESKISQSERSFGSMLQYFNDLIQTLNLLPGYNPSNPLLQITNLQQFAVQLVQLSSDVAIRYQQLRDARYRRNVLYDELHDRAQRIKAYVKANYGTQSSEYDLVKGLRV